MRSTAIWAYYAWLRPSGTAPGYGFERFGEKAMVLFYQFPVILLFEGADHRRLVYRKMLVLRAP